MENRLSFAEETGWINIRTFIPEPGVEMVVKTPWGIRKAIRNTAQYGPIYLFTDCDHPMQNMALSPYDIEGWRFARAEDAANLSLHQNHWQMEKDGEEILKYALHKPISFFKKLLKKLNP